MAENQNMIAYCGLYCNECMNYTGAIANLARDLRKELRNFRFDKAAEALSQVSFFKEFENYGKCYETLGAMVKLRCNKGCRDGGGNPNCKIRTCAVKKKFKGCWECTDFETCSKLDSLRQGHGIAHIQNLKIISKKGADEFVRGKKHWYLKDK